ncbi:hypothetical protein IWQ52_004931 [Labrenzia sp. EL_159]|nr:hypothetical protein [Roseibium album]MBG6143513.1 hypothetical protein [Labrenzia sp. EL_142]MBG6158850.1 hypothetical protein [Labrenzia sp. EL_162]MBG6197384.1 hypothetical protein [Labrenzia sp. EL_159]MCR9056243.1 hypothetical protein [Paracoccaceae bacterium]
MASVIRVIFGVSSGLVPKRVSVKQFLLIAPEQVIFDSVRFKDNIGKGIIERVLRPVNFQWFTGQCLPRFQVYPVVIDPENAFPGYDMKHFGAGLVEMIIHLCVGWYFNQLHKPAFQVNLLVPKEYFLPVA